MSEPPRLTPAKQAEHSARAKRLAQALRQNLHRRKRQAREKGEPQPAESPQRDPADRSP